MPIPGLVTGDLPAIANYKKALAVRFIRVKLWHLYLPWGSSTKWQRAIAVCASCNGSNHPLRENKHKPNCRLQTRRLMTVP